MNKMIVLSYNNLLLCVLTVCTLHFDCVIIQKDIISYAVSWRLIVLTIELTFVYMYVLI